MQRSRDRSNFGSRILLARLAGRQLALVVPLLAAGCGDGRVWVLGQSEPRGWQFGEARPLLALASPAKTDNPTLSADLLELYFTSERAGTADIFVAERSDPDDAFGTPRRVDALSTSGTETSPIVSADALTLYWASDRAGGVGDLDIWLATRPERNGTWSSPLNVRTLNSEAKDLPRLPGLHDTIMPLSSDRGSRGYYAVLFARSSDDAHSFAAPEPVPELEFAGASTVDGFLTDDGLTLFYVTGPAIGAADMFVASRRTPSEPFEHFAPLDALNTPSDERDPWLSADRTRFFFASNRSGVYTIYEAEVLAR